jgi:transcriptional regulator with XRE-family HTH domain
MEANKERLRQNLTDKEYREQYADSTLVGDIAIQVQALRRQRGLSQADLATRIGSKQPKISAIETPRNGDRLPNWELGTLCRIAHALGTRLKIRFETYGSLVDELETLTTESLRRPDVEDDNVLFPRPPMPAPDPKAPERTRWIQELMIPWLWSDRLDIPRLIGWLQGHGLPPVGHEEEPYHWLLRGIAVKGPARDYLEKRFAERLAIVLGEQPDVQPIVDDAPDEFLLNLYWTCAGLIRPGFLGEQLWSAYRRLKGSKVSGAVRDALQGALVHNQFGETKPLRELWAPMVEKGRHYWLRGDEIVGYEGILLRHRSVKPNLETIFWALGRISKLWETSFADRQSRFKRLIEGTPELNSPDAVNQMINFASRSDSGWQEWARKLVMVDEEQKPPAPREASAGLRARAAPLSLKLRQGSVAVLAEWSPGQPLTGALYFEDAAFAPFGQQGFPTREPNVVVFLNAVLTELGNAQDVRPDFGFPARMLHARAYHLVQQSRQQPTLHT